MPGPNHFSFILTLDACCIHNMVSVQELLHSAALRVVGLSVQMATETLTDLHHLSSGGKMDHALFYYV